MNVDGELCDRLVFRPDRQLGDYDCSRSLSTGGKISGLSKLSFLAAVMPAMVADKTGYLLLNDHLVIYFT